MLLQRGQVIIHTNDLAATRDQLTLLGFTPERQDLMTAAEIKPPGAGLYLAFQDVFIEMLRMSQLRSNYPAQLPIHLKEFGSHSVFKPIPAFGPTAYWREICDSAARHTDRGCFSSGTHSKISRRRWPSRARPSIGLPRHHSGPE